MTDPFHKIKALVYQHFGIQASSIKKMDGYESHNFLIETNNQKYVFKLYEDASEIAPQILAESEILDVLNQENQSFYPRPILSKNKNWVVPIENDYCVRLLSFLEGTFLAEADQTPALLQDFGRFLANMDKVLLHKRNIAIEARSIDWDLKNCLDNQRFLKDIEDPNKRKIVEYFFLQFKEKVQPHFFDLRKSIIHNDANDWNVLTKDEKIVGIIDFGDMVYSALIHNLAIAFMYIMMDKEYPIQAALPMLKAYHNILPLLERELEVLYYLVAGRLCTSVCKSAYSKKINPDNEYISISEKPAWALLEKLLTINPIEATNEFKKVCGFKVEEKTNIKAHVQRRHVYFSKSLSLSYKEPIKMSSAAFQYMYDADGKTYLDAYNNIPLVGHSHPKVVEAGQRQMAKLNTNTRYIYDILHEYAEALLAKFPDSLNKIFFVNSGSAASDLAVRLAYTHTKRQNLMVMEHGYHGNTQIGIDISDYKFNGKGGQGAANYILTAPIPDTYRGIFRDNLEEAGKNYAEAALKVLKESKKHIAALIAEPALGCGGQVILPDGYFQHLFPKIREHGGLCIVDETQVGFGRVGSHFWGYETQDVIPDIVILGKPIGNGHPMAAVVTTSEIAQSFENGMEFFSSFGGNPVSCAIGLAVLEVLAAENLQANALEVGNYWMDALRNLQNKYEAIGEVRGLGLFLGMDMVEDRISRKPATQLAAHLKNELKKSQILVSTDGPFDNVLKAKPPLCFTKENVDRVVAEMDRILSES